VDPVDPDYTMSGSSEFGLYNECDDRTMLWLWQSTGARKRTCLPDPAVCPLNLLFLGEKGGKGKKKKKHAAGLLTWPAFNVILCLDAGTPPSWWPCAYSSKLTCCHATPLPPCSCTRFALLSSHHCPLVHARGLHSSHHTTASFTHSIQNATVNST
jgi:hypothetical protein